MFVKGAILILSLILASGSVIADLQCSIPGQCVNSDLIQSEAEDDQYSCHNQCKNNDECNWFTYIADQGFCEQFSNCFNITDATCSSCITSEKDCDLYKCGIQGSCQGRVDHEEETESEEKCLAACLADPDCNWYTYNSALLVCLLFEDCPSIDQDCSTCISGERGCTARKPMTKLLVTTGSPTSTVGKLSEIIDIENPDLTCDDYYDYPGSVLDGAVGGLLSGDRPFICGGGSTANCYILGNSSVQATMTRSRQYAAAIVTNDGTRLWVTGGFPSYIDTTEYVTPGQNPVKGPSLPQGVDTHCLVQLDDETYMTLGGRVSGGYTPKTFFFHAGNQSFTPGPELSSGKFGMFCGVVQTTSGNDKVVLAAGGKGTSGTLNVIDSWTVGSSSNKFTKLDKTLPKPLSESRAIVTSDEKSMIIIGGFSQSDELVKVTCSSVENCNAETMEQKLRNYRYWPVGMLIPDSLPTCQ